MADALQDTLLLITADHGLVDVECEELEKHPALLECIVRPPSMEARAVNFFVKEGQMERFERLFLSCFGDSFLLLAKAEVLENQLLGTGCNHPRLGGMLGDYLAVAVGNKALRMVSKGYTGEHAGMTEDEMTIPLIAVEKE